MVAFAGNSLLCRAALGTSSIDAASFTTLRLLSGAVVLLALARALPASRASTHAARSSRVSLTRRARAQT
jgi:hypothetical protein